MLIVCYYDLPVYWNFTPLLNCFFFLDSNGLIIDLFSVRQTIQGLQLGAISWTWSSQQRVTATGKGNRIISPTGTPYASRRRPSRTWTGSLARRPWAMQRAAQIYGSPGEPLTRNRASGPIMTDSVTAWAIPRALWAAPGGAALYNRL